jgi:putative NADH-flavin reductase
MKIAVVGATGATGRSVVRLALAQGHLVTAVARHPERVSPAEHLTVVRADVLAVDGLRGAFDGVDVVISCIGPDRNLSPGALMSVGIANILAECAHSHVHRFIMQSGIGLSDGHELSWISRMVVRLSGRIFSSAVADKAVAERLTEQSGVAWVIVRAVALIDRPANGHYTAGPAARVSVLSALPFDDCAGCLLRAATGEPTWIGRIVNVGS